MAATKKKRPFRSVLLSGAKLSAPYMAGLGILLLVWLTADEPGDAVRRYFVYLTLVSCVVSNVIGGSLGLRWLALILTWAWNIALIISMAWFEARLTPDGRLYLGLPLAWIPIGWGVFEVTTLGKLAWRRCVSRSGPRHQRKQSDDSSDFEQL